MTDTSAPHAIAEVKDDAKVRVTLFQNGKFVHVPLDAMQKGLRDSVVAKSGDTMTGPLILSGEPTEDAGAATKAYADTKLSKSGGQMTGSLLLVAAPTANTEAATKQYVDGKVAKTGDTMTGALSLFGTPTSTLHAATKQYVDVTAAKRGQADAILEDQKAQATNGQSIPGATWTARDLNTKVKDSGGILSVSSNTFAVSVACEAAWEAPAVGVSGSGTQVSRIYSVTDSIALPARGLCIVFSETSSPASTGRSLLEAGKTYRLESYCTTDARTGNNANNGGAEIYTRINFWRTE